MVKIGTGYMNKNEFEEKEEWLLDLSGRMMFSFDSLSDDISSIGGSADFSKFDWKVRILLCSQANHIMSSSY